MIPTIQLEEVRYADGLERAARREAGDGVRLAQACMLEEILGAVLGSITLWYLVSSIISLA